MTIRFQHLTISPDARSWISAPDDGVSVTNDVTRDNDMLSVVRHIMRDRGDCTMIPVIREAVVHPVNRWGHNMTVEVTYSTRGYRAVYGVTVADRVTEVSCYMD